MVHYNNTIIQGCSHGGLAVRGNFYQCMAQKAIAFRFATPHFHNIFLYPTLIILPYLPFHL